MWPVLFSPVFDAWFEEQDEGAQEKVLADLSNLEAYGPNLSRPYADTVNGARNRNMKELRIQHGGRPIRASLPLILSDRLSCCVPVIRATTRGFTTK